MLIQYDELVTETDNAFGLEIDEKLVWLPKSLCMIDEDEKIIDCSDWLAYEKGLEGYSL